MKGLRPDSMARRRSIEPLGRRICSFIRAIGKKQAIAHARLDAPLLNVPILHLSRKLDETGDVLLNVAKFAFQLGLTSAL